MFCIDTVASGIEDKLNYLLYPAGKAILLLSNGHLESESKPYYIQPFLTLIAIRNIAQPKFLSPSHFAHEFDLLWLSWRLEKF